MIKEVGTSLPEAFYRSEMRGVGVGLIRVHPNGLFYVLQVCYNTVRI